MSRPWLAPVILVSVLAFTINWPVADSAADLAVKLVSIDPPTPVSGGHPFTLTIQTEAGAVCSVKTWVANQPSNVDLTWETKTADDAGRIVWNHKTGVVKGARKGTVTCSSNGDKQTLLFDFEVS